jgi:pyruvate kinase
MPTASANPRRTRIVATLGPVTDPPAVLRAVLEAGVDVARINFSHGTSDAGVVLAGHPIEGGERLPTIRLGRVGEGGRAVEP